MCWFDDVPGRSRFEHLRGRLVLLIFSGVFLLFSVSSPTLAAGDEPKPGIWVGPDDEVLPFQSYGEIEEFLRTARIKGVKKILTGVTKPKKVLLEKDGIQMHAIFRDVDVFKQRWETSEGMKLNFRDSCLFEAAAYRLSLLLGIDNVPPVVRRKLEKEDFQDRGDWSKFDEKDGTIQAWVENAFNEKERRARGLRPRDNRLWGYQLYVMRIFDNLIFNDDRNQTNILIGPDWKIWFIDSTRAFRRHPDLPEPERVSRCDRTVWENLKSITDESLERELGEFINGRELSCLKARKKKLVKLIQSMVDERGEERTLFELY
jgi:hypothetical protein